MGLDLDLEQTSAEDTPEAKAPQKAADKEARAVTMEVEDKGSEELVAEKAGEALAGAMAEATKAAKDIDSKKVNDRRFDIQIDEARDDNLTEFGKETLTDRYLLPDEKFQDLDGIVNTWNENVWLASKGGGIGTYWGNVRGIGEPVGLNGKTSGIIPFVRVMDSLTLAISQGSLRRGSAACYIDVNHPEIEEFLEIRKPSGDFNRKALNLHHGVLLTDEFMEAVREGAEFELKSPKTGEVRGTVDARSLFQKLVETRLATGEPYIVFSDTVNRMMPKHHRELGLKVSTLMRWHAPNIPPRASARSGWA